GARPVPPRRAPVRKWHPCARSTPPSPGCVPHRCTASHPAIPAQLSRFAHFPKRLRGIAAAIPRTATAAIPQDARRAVPCSETVLQNEFPKFPLVPHLSDTARKCISKFLQPPCTFHPRSP